MHYAELSSPLYHGSDISFTKIDLSYSSPKKDYGSGFYTTNEKAQAEKFARLKARRSRAPKGYVESFNLQDCEGLSIKKFNLADNEWFDYVLFNRGFGGLVNMPSCDTFDIVIGPVANDAVGLVLNQFVAGTFGDPMGAEAKATAIRLLLAQKLHNQIFFGTERAVLRLDFCEVSDVCLD